MTTPTNVKPTPAPAEQKPTTPPAPTFTFSKELLLKRLNEIVAFQKTFAGKPGHNPFLWIKANVEPLGNRLLGISPDGHKIPEEVTKELHDEIMRLPLDYPPKILKIKQ